MFTIHLHNLKFFARHGLHEEETITGGQFELSVDIDFDSEETIRKMDQTINYVTVFQVISKHMLKPEPMLETLAQQIVEEIHSLDARIRKINIRINKMHPPIPSFNGQVGVTFQKVF
jgi:dihydroneopterin aldolase